MSKRPAVFLDLNGTLVTPVVVDRLEDLMLIEGTAEQVARLCRAGFLCPVVTVQSRIEKGVFSEADFRAWFVDVTRRMSASGATLLGPYVCPHRFRTPCGCKKPQTLLYEQAAADHGIDLPASYVVGDSTADVEAARRFGGCGCFLLSPYGAERGKRAPGLASFTGRSIAEVVDWILSREAAEQADAPDEAQLSSRTAVEPRR